MISNIAKWYVQSCSDKFGTILFFEGNVGWTLNNISMDFVLPEQLADFIYLSKLTGDYTF
jgi:hypothetical protein